MWNIKPLALMIEKSFGMCWFRQKAELQNDRQDKNNMLPDLRSRGQQNNKTSKNQLEIETLEKYMMIVKQNWVRIRVHSGWNMSPTEREWIDTAAAPLQGSDGVVAYFQKYQNTCTRKLVTLL